MRVNNTHSSSRGEEHQARVKNTEKVPVVCVVITGRAAERRERKRNIYELIIRAVRCCEGLVQVKLSDTHSYSHFCCNKTSSI